MKKLVIIILGLLMMSQIGKAQQTVLIPAKSQSQGFSGLKVTYDEQGIKVSEIEFFAGQPQGKINRYHANGELRETGYYIAGKKHGSWSSYDEEGKIRNTAHFNNGSKDGEWLVWDTDGNLRYKLTYKNGEPVGEWAMYDAQGKISERKQVEDESSNVLGK
jgi:antitoxin component YwqK of YwqJK toxin-antitoxin module